MERDERYEVNSQGAIVEEQLEILEKETGMLAKLE